MTETAAERIETTLIELVKQSAAHGAKLDSIDHRLDTLNGSVARHEKRLVDVEAAAATTRAEEIGAQRAAKQYQRWFLPFLKGLGVAAGAIAAEHSGAIAAMFKTAHQ